MIQSRSLPVVRDSLDSCRNVQGEAPVDSGVEVDDLLGAMLLFRQSPPESLKRSPLGW